MHRRIPKLKAPRGRKRSGTELTTAFLLPDLHPWLKEYFADRNLMPLRDEAWVALPKWEAVPEKEEVRVKSEEWRVEAPVPNQSMITESVVTSNSELSTLNSQLPSGARRSEAPVPFIIPVHAAAPTPSRHLLRITRPQATRSAVRAPNFIAALRQGLEPIRNAGGLLRTAEQAPMPRVPPPWNELLIVNIVGGTVGIFWRDLLWPLWSALHLPHPRALKRSVELRVKSFEFRMKNFEWHRHDLYELLRIPPTRRAPQTAHSRPPLQLLPLHSSLFTFHFRPAFAFGLALTIVLLPLKLLDLHAQFPAVRGRVLSATAETIETFRAGGSAVARSSFTEAIAAFDHGRAVLERIPDTAGPFGRIGVTIGRHLPGWRATLGLAEEGRRAGVALAEASAAATRGLAVLEAADLADPNVAALLDAATAAFATARRHATDARAHVDTAAPTFLGTIDRAIGELRRAEHLLPILRALGGIDRPRRLLLVFQNPSELRPTGGFMGSIALVDVVNGRVTALELPPGGTYDLSGLTRTRVIPPDPLRLVAPTWQFHDANWFPDFPTSARKLRWFYEASGGPSVDAIVAVNAPVLEDILTLTGPITVGGQTFSATAVRTILTDTIESATARASGRPKTIVATLAPEVLRRLLAITDGGSPTQRIELLDRLVRALEERDVLLAFTDDEAQRHAIEASWAGEVRATDRDALLVVHTNIGGGKSDGVIRDAIQHTASILDDGSIVDRVQVMRTHEGTPVPPTATPSERLAGLANVDFLRIYVPRGAELLSARGFESPPPDAFEAIPTDAIPDRLLLATELGETIDPTSGVRITEEFGRTVFGGWLQTPPGASRIVTIVYRLPWRYERTTRGVFGRKEVAAPQPYAFTIQKQPGTRSTIHHVVELAPIWQTTWTSRNLIPRGTRVWALEDILTTDLATGMMVAPTK